MCVVCRVGAVRALVARAAEGCFLLQKLGDHNLGRLAARCDDATQRSLRDALKLRDWVTGAHGEAAAAALISVLITEHLSATGGPTSASPLFLSFAESSKSAFLLSPGLKKSVGHLPSLVFAPLVTAEKFPAPLLSPGLHLSPADSGGWCAT